MGEVDPAAAFEYVKGRGFLYEANYETSCLVEMDEEPPHRLSEEAVDICLTAALMFQATVVDEIHVMRKIVIDGSNTTGFQRTCVIALGGEIEVEGEKFQLQTICLEEDAARKTGEKHLTTRYRLDRLCIPLIEVATAPVIFTPKDAEKVAQAIGGVLRATKKVRRGLGTIRQDLNISIRGGALTEIKGVQELDLISKVVKFEAERQIALLRIRDELARRGVSKEDFSEDFIDITGIFKKTMCKVIRKAIEEGGYVKAVVLPRFKGILRFELSPGLRFGTELADYAKFWGRVGGIFHTDELPAYGISIREVEELKKIISVEKDDAVVFVAAEEENTVDALKAVVIRAKQALDGVPSETRGAAPDGTTHYTRPRPGAARMYPETDVPPLPVTPEHLSLIMKKLPESPESKLSRLISEYGLNEKLANQLVKLEYDEVFERIAGETRVSSSFLAAALTETLKSLRREGLDIEKFSEDMLLELFKSVDEGIIAKEAIPDVLRWIGRHGDAKIRDAVEALGLKMISEEEVERIIEKIVEENGELIRLRGVSALDPLTGYIMKKYRGRVDVKKVRQRLREMIEARIR